MDSHIPLQCCKPNKVLRLDHRNQKMKEASSRHWVSRRDPEEAARVRGCNKAEKYPVKFNLPSLTKSVSLVYVGLLLCSKEFKIKLGVLGYLSSF